MGLFGLLNDFLDESKDNPLEKGINSFVDKVEDTIGAALDKAESGVSTADRAVTKLEKGSEKLGNQADFISTKISQQD